MNSATIPFSGPCPTIWSGDGARSAWRIADDLVVAGNPPAVQVHSWDATVISSIGAALPSAKIVLGVGIDGIAKRVAQATWSITRGAKEAVELAQRASDAGAVAICWNAEAAWKRPPSTEEAARIGALVRDLLQSTAMVVPALQQWHTAYDHPSYHSTYPWKAWLGAGSPVVASLPQVYAAPGGDLAAHRGALPAREARALSSWADAVRKGWIRPDAPEGSPEDATDVDWLPYYQLHHVTTHDTVESAIRHRAAFLWALPTRADGAGRLAYLALCALFRLGFWYQGGILSFQRAYPRSGAADGILGPRTMRELFAAARINPSVAAVGP